MSRRLPQKHENRRQEAHGSENSEGDPIALGEIVKKTDEKGAHKCAGRRNRSAHSLDRRKGLGK
jgi:hypothetical protein